MLQFFGGHKGYALAILVEVLSGALAGGYTYEEGNLGKGNGVFMPAINPEGFDSAAAVRERTERLFGRIKAVRRRRASRKCSFRASRR